MQQLDPEAFADMVLQTVDTALAPVLQRLAAAEARVQMLGDVRDRVVTMEAKSAAAPAPAAAHELEALRQWCLLELERRSAAAISGITGVREEVFAVEDKVAAIEAKSAAPVGETRTEAAIIESLNYLRERLAAAEALARQPGPQGPAGANGLDGKDGAPGKDGRDGIDGKDGAPGLNGGDGNDGAPGKDGLNGKDGRDGIDGKDGAPGLNGKDGLNGFDGKDGAPGLNGKDGANGLNGKDGLPGKDGVDGVSLDDLSVVQEDERTLIIRGTVGAKVKDIGSVTFPVDIYRGVWIEGKQYNRGDGATWAGSEWHCNKTTYAKPGDGSKDWTLKVKKGRDGRDGKDAPGALPVVKA